MQYTVTNDSVTLIIDGVPKSVRSTNPNYRRLRDAVLNGRWGEARDLVNLVSAVKRWSRGNYTLSPDGAKLLYWGKPVPEKFGDRVLAMLSDGLEVSGLLQFHERLAQNPSKNSVKQLYRFLQDLGIPIEPKGTFLTYKSVRKDFRDHYTGKVDYTPPKFGDPQKFVDMDRSKISDDPTLACHEGLHVGALPYVDKFSSHTNREILICRIDPKDVVCVPNDASFQKMRVCRLEVLGVWSGVELPRCAVDLNLTPDLVSLG